VGLAVGELGDQTIVSTEVGPTSGTSGHALTYVIGSPSSRQASGGPEVGTWEFDLGSLEVSWSPEQYRLHGLDPSGAVPTFQEWLDLVEPDDRVSIMAARDALRAPDAGSLWLEFRVRGGDGGPRWLMCRCRVVPGAGGRSARVTGISVDITAQRKAESELLRSSAVLRAIGSCSPDLIYAKDTEGRFLFANPAALAVIGKPAAEVIGRTSREVHANPVQAAAIQEDDRRVLAGDHAGAVDEKYDTASGTRIFRAAKAPLLLEDGTAIGTVAVSHDVTHTRRAEALLRSGMERFRETFELAAVGMAHLDTEGNWIRVNGCFCRMLGYGKRDLLAKAFLELTHPDDAADDMVARGRLLAGCISASTVEKRYLRKDGTHLWAEVNLSLVRDREGTPQYFISVVEDISGRKAAEAALRESGQWLRALFESAPLPGYLFDLKAASIVDCNNAAAEMLGYARDALRHMRIADIDPNVARDGVLLSRDHVMAGRPLRFETRHRTRAGEIRDVTVAIVPADIGGRRLAHATVADVTERKRAEAELRHVNADLAARVCEETAARETAQVRAAQAERLQALGQLAGGVAHDFNNVLQAVQGGSAVIVQRAADADVVRRYARLMGDAASRGASITGRLLAFARGGDLRSVPIGVPSLLDGMREILAPTLGGGISVMLEVEPGLPPLLADKSQMETALVNLATNARDAMPTGGTLTFSAASRTVGLESSGYPAGIACGGYLRISVADTGSGMDAAMLARVCQPFFTTKPPGRGTGLGLAMVKGFAEQSGGGITIDSTPGRGTEVSLWLPVAAVQDGKPDQTPAKAPVAALGRGKPPILVVDDDPLVLDTLAVQLDAEGFAVAVAANGTQAMALLDGGLAVQALVSDLSMAGMDGITLIREVQARCPQLPAILLTGYSGDGADFSVWGQISGPFRLVQKPVSGPVLAALISAIIAAQAEA